VQSVRAALLFVGATLAIGMLIHCGGDSPTQAGGTSTTTLPATTTTTAPSGIVLPPGMTCSPTPPPLYGMHVKVHAGDPGRLVLDSKPLVANVDGYCDRVVGTSGRFCDTRVEGDLQRKACDYLVVGQADNGRWGPNWWWDDKPCGGANTDQCNNHASEQFMAIAKVNGKYEACASDKAKVAPDGTRCGVIDIKN
jgi:hypothetical protein